MSAYTQRRSSGEWITGYVTGNAWRLYQRIACALCMGMVGVMAWIAFDPIGFRRTVLAGFGWLMGAVS